MVYSAGLEVAQLLIGLGCLIFLIVVSVAISDSFISQRKTWKYRKYLMDLFVAGRIKQEAEKHQINLDEMKLEFEKWNKLSKRENIKDLDDKIERDLIEETEKEVKGETK